MFIVVEEKRKGMPYTSTEKNLINLSFIIKNLIKEPVSAEEMESDFWFYEKGKGFFLGDTTFFNERYIGDSDLCERGVNGSIGAFQAIGGSSSLPVRSKK